MDVAVGETGKGEAPAEIDDPGIGRNRGANLSEVARSTDPLPADGDRPDGAAAVSGERSVYEKAVRRQSAVG
jgi:hypothetical protein